jgi:hypothetical protein
MIRSTKQENEISLLEAAPSAEAETPRGLTGEFALTLTEEERAQLLDWLKQRLRRVLIEEHRTDAIDYKDYVRHQEEILESVMKKLRRS